MCAVYPKVKPGVMGHVGGHDAFLVPIPKGSVEGGFIIAAAYAQLMIVPLGAVVENYALPVGPFSERIGIGESRIFSRGVFSQP